MNARKTQNAAPPEASAGGTEKIRMKARGSRMPARRRNGRRLPTRAAARSDSRPTMGRTITSHALGTATTNAAAPAATPSVLVR